MSSGKNQQEETLRLSSWTALRHISRYVRKHPWMFATILLSVVGAAVSSRALPWIIGRIVDQAVLPKNGEIFFQLALLYLGGEILKTVFIFLRDYYFQVFGNRMLYYVREDIYSHVMDLPLDYFNRTPAGRTVTRMTNDVAALGELFSEGVVTIFTQSVMMTTTMVAMCLISWKLALLTLFSVPVFMFLANRLMIRVRGLMHIMKAKLSTMNAFLAENISGIRIVQLHDRTQSQTNKFNRLAAEYRSQNLEVIRNHALLQPILNLMNATLLTTALIAGGWFSLESLLPLGAMVTFIMYAQDFVQPVREILEKIQNFQNSLTSAERVFHLLEEPKEIDTPEAWSGDLQGRISFKKLSFRYRDDLPFALQDINVEIPVGKSVALVGRTGSGKTTFISLLQRFYDPPPGAIFIDDRPIETYPRRALRRRLGVIQQDPVLFRGSLLFNLTMGHPEVTPERARQACERIGLLRPLDLFIEERGSNLSLGERQLIAFARILAFDPHVLIMDEATANIDSETEQILQRATSEVTKGRTSLLIAHRLSTIENCDVIIVLEKGKIVEQGAPTTLKNSGGAYAQFASAGLKSMRTEDVSEGIADP